MKFQKFLPALVAVVLTCTLWGADSGTRLRCKVLDGSKALVTGAKLTLRGGSFTASGASNDEGEFVFVNLPAGSYHLTVEKDGFSRAELDSITLDLNEVRVLDVTLAPQGDVQSVEVKGGDQVSIVPQQTFLRGLVDPLRMQQLPLNGRNFADLIYTQPGVTRDFSDPLTGIARSGSSNANV